MAGALAHDITRPGIERRRERRRAVEGVIESAAFGQARREREHGICQNPEAREDGLVRAQRLAAQGAA